MSRRALALIFGFVISMLIIAVMTALIHIAAGIAERFADVGPELPATAKFAIRVTQDIQQNFVPICAAVVVVSFGGAWIVASIYRKRQPD